MSYFDRSALALPDAETAAEATEDASPWREGAAPGWSQSLVVFADLVESVRLMELDEVGVINRWRGFVAWVKGQVLADGSGRMVKSLGDGFLLEFRHVHEAVAAAHRLHAGIRAFNTDVDEAREMWLRVGLHVTRVLRDDFDLYGSGVNLGARIAASARPGQTVVSAAVRARVVPALDGQVQDLGETYLKNVEGTHRLFAITPVAPAPGAPPPRRRNAQGLKPRIAVAPMQLAPHTDQSASTVHALTDYLISSLSRTDQWAITSRLSIGALGERPMANQALAELLDVQYLMRSTLEGRQGGYRLRAALYERTSHQVIWESAYEMDIHAMLANASPLGTVLAAELGLTVIKRQINLSHRAALPTLAGYTLLLSAISRLHSLSPDDMQTARDMLEHLVDRYPRSAEARAWLAQWHFVQVAQVSSADLGDTVRRARVELDRARDLEPDHALAWALAGHLSAYAEGDLDTAEASLKHAQTVGPNESLTALFLAQLFADTGRGAQAVESVDLAHRLSPLDPMGYYHQVFAASAYSSAGRHQEALAFARKALELNALHLSSWVQLIIEQVLTGRLDEARDSAQHYLVMRPTASVARYKDRHAGKGHALAQRNADALLAAGLPW